MNFYSDLVFLFRFITLGNFSTAIWSFSQEIQHNIFSNPVMMDALAVLKKKQHLLRVKSVLFLLGDRGEEKERGMK